LFIRSHLLTHGEGTAISAPAPPRCWWCAGLLLALLIPLAPCARACPPTQAAPSYFQHPGHRSASSVRNLAPYALQPQLRDKAIRYSHVQYAIYFGGVALALGIFALLWLAGFGPWLRKLCGRVSPRLLVQCAIFVPIFWIIVSAIEFPLDYYSGWIVERRFDLSTQGFVSWLGDWGKTFGLTLIVMILVAWAFYRIVRRSPKRWWLFFWLVLIPPALFVMFIEPYVVEPLYFKFTPLERTDAPLTARIENMLHRAGITIPESRIYEMNASAKTRALNAYVSGIGHSKHVVVFDTTLRRLTPNETLSVLAHETGHYVLHHVPKEFAFDEIIALGWFFVGFVVLRAILRRTGPVMRIEGLADLASLPLVMLILTAILFLASPMYCAISRHYEHQADQYGLELTYGIIPHSNATAVRTFQILEADDLSDPDPNPFVVLWIYTHPPVAARIRFAERYRPWAEGKPMQLVREPGS
jgi:STE24 endopeptidase